MEESNNITVQILGKNYPIKCSPDQVQFLQDAAQYLDREMRKVRDSGKVIGLDRIAIITALNITYKLLNFEKKENKDIDEMFERLKYIQQRIEQTLTQSEQLELMTNE